MVSCILPTANRPHLLAAAVRLFQAQTYADKELVILDDGEDLIDPGTLLGSPCRYYREDAGRTLGEKHNRLVELARGDIICHWADDDWYAPWRLAYQVGILEQLQADMVAPSQTLWVDAGRELAWHFHPEAFFYNAAELVYRKDLWLRSKYDDVATGEDAAFVRNQLAIGGVRFDIHPEFRFAVQRIHGSNTSSNTQMNDAWLTPVAGVRAIIGKDWDAYFGGPNGLPR